MSDCSFFVTGTDTGVGKTIVTAALTAVLRTKGRDVVPMKPVQTGPTSDLDTCLRLASVKVSAAERQRMCPYQFALAAAPHLAAQKEGMTISIDYIRHAFGELRSRHDGVVVEGAGGVLAPLGEGLTMMDIISALHLPVIVVARPGLGTLNHTLLTLHELQRAKLTVRAVVLNESQPGPWTEIEEDNLQTLRRISGVPIVEKFSYVADLNAGLAGAAVLFARFL